MVTDTQFEYLDLDGDGVPDAVRTIDTHGAWSDRVGDFEVVGTVDELALDIDDDGVPASVHVISSDVVVPAPARWQPRAA
jgi:hypothetical protein